MRVMPLKDFKHNGGGSGGDVSLGNMSWKYFLLLLTEQSKIVFPSETMKKKQCV